MSKIGRIALYATKQYAREQERKRKLEVKEHQRKEKVWAAKKERVDKRKEFQNWCHKEESWKKIFDGTLTHEINWEVKLDPHVFKEPERPKSDELLERRIKTIKTGYRNRILLLVILIGVFLIALVQSKTTQEFVIYTSGCVFSVIGINLKNRWNRRILIELKNCVLKEKKCMDDAYVQMRETAFSLHKAKEDERIAKITSLLQGQEIEIKKTAEHYLGKLIWPRGVTFNIKALQDQTIQLDILIPGLEIIQTKTAVWDDKRGIVKFGPKNQKEIIKQYERLVAAVVLRSGWEILRSSPAIKDIYVRVNTKKFHRTKGISYEGCVLSCILNRKEYYEIDFKHVEYIYALENFQLRYSPRGGTEIPGDIAPHSPCKASVNLTEDIFQIDVDSMNGDQFEDFIKDLVERMGMKAEKTKKSHDGGIDIWAFSEHELTGGQYIIQCKRWKPTISVDVIRDLYGAVTRERADRGILITNSKISSDCFKFVNEAPYKVPITLIQGSQLNSLIRQYGMAE